jgi:hypothetical protein
MSTQSRSEQTRSEQRGTIEERERAMMRRADDIGCYISREAGGYIITMNDSFGPLEETPLSLDDMEDYLDTLEVNLSMPVDGEDS